ncbi:MAG: hypothetical protein HOB73_07130 [Planctomycetaceae bacterium]|jgi:hypothetical protein|nr:hypothetical protein [Planctomycetaceae bacterium]
MKTLILNAVALTVGLVISTNLSANDFGFPSAFNNGNSYSRNTGNYRNNTPSRTQGRSRSMMEGSSNQFQDFLQQIERSSGVQHRESRKRLVYHREVEHLEIETMDIDHRSFNVENILNQFRSGASDSYRNSNRMRYNGR